MKNKTSKGEKKTFVEPKLTKQETLVKSTLIGTAAAPGASAVTT